MKKIHLKILTFKVLALKKLTILGVALFSLTSNILTSNASEVVLKQEYKVTPEMLKNIDPLSYHVTQEDGTERPFDNKYWNHKEDGIYVDVVSGEPLFASVHKFDSGTGWPSFTQPLNQSYIEENTDQSHGMSRTEVRSKNADSHLGHVFDDGPKDAGGMRYCINSASLKFIAKDDLEKEGYGEYLSVFEK